MSATASTPVPAQTDLRQWTLCALAGLGFSPIDLNGGGQFRAVPPQQLAEDPVLQGFLSNGELLFSFAPGSTAETLALDSPLFTWLADQVEASGGVLHARPVNQPTSVSQIAPKLFEYYEVAGGRMQLGGCQLEDRPIVKYMYRLENEGGDDSLVYRLVHPHGGPVEAELIEALELHDIEPYPTQQRMLNGDQRALLLEEGAQQSSEIESGSQTASLAGVTVVWCKYAIGKLTFFIGESEAEISYEGWARLLAEGRQQPPPFKCDESSLESYQLAATDEGEITTPEAIATCAGSGKRGLAVKMEPSELSGKLALPDALVRCPVSDQRVLESELVTCPMCGQAVAPNALRGQRCKACRKLETVSKDDPRMARALGQYPGLDHWRRWKIAETDRVYILLAVGWCGNS